MINRLKYISKSIRYSNVLYRLLLKFSFSLLICCPSIALAASHTTGQGLPPHWQAGGKAKLKLMPRHAIEESKGQEQSGHQSKIRSGIDKNFSVGVALSTPELLRLDAKYQPSEYLSLRLSAGPGWPFKITVEMPSDVIQADKTKTLAAAYPAFNADFDATWGPHILATANVHPFAGAWFISFGGGFRQLTLKGAAESPLRICAVSEAAKEPPCANDQASLQTRNSLRVEAKAVLTSTLLQAGTGWQWQPGDSWEILLAGGMVRPLKTTPRISANAEIVAPDGAPQEVSGSLAELKTKSETDLADKAEKELRNFADMTLPVLTLGLNYRF